MEIKKINTCILPFVVIIVICIASIFILPFCGDITQYKRIGNTKYYLFEHFGNAARTDLRYRYDNDFWGENVKFEGLVKDVYWNKTYIIIKCTSEKSTEITYFCIIRQQGVCHQNVPWDIYEYHTEKEFEEAKQRLSLDEDKMGYTDAHIPWSLHLFE